MELNINNISIAHQKEKIIKIFDNKDECLKFADDFRKDFGIDLRCDPLDAFLLTVENHGAIEFWNNIK